MDWQTKNKYPPLSVKLRTKKSLVFVGEKMVELLTFWGTNKFLVMIAIYMLEKNKCVYEWRKPGEGWRPDLVPKQNTVWWYGDVFVLMESELNAQKYIHLTFWALISGLSLPITFRHEINFFSGWQCSIHRARVVQEFITHKKLHNRYEWTSRLQIFGCTLIKVSHSSRS